MPCSLDSFSFLTADQVRQYIGLELTDIRSNAFHVYHTGAGGVSAATVEVTATQLILTATGGSSATLGLAGYATMTLVKAAVDAVAGWVFELDCPGDAPPTDLVVTASQSCLLAANVAYVQFYNYCLIYDLINYACSAIETLCNRRFSARYYTHRFITDRKGNIRIRHFPVQWIEWLAIGRRVAFSVTNTTSSLASAQAVVYYDPTPDSTIYGTSVGLRLEKVASTGASSNLITLAEATSIAEVLTAINAVGGGWSATTTLTTAEQNSVSTILPTQGAKPCLSPRIADIEMPNLPFDDFQLIEPEAGIVHVGVPKAEVFIRYRGGYTSIPYDLQLIALQAVAGMYRQQSSSSSTDDTLTSERIGDYSYTRGQTQTRSQSSGFSQGNSLLSGDILSSLGPYISDGWSDR